VSVCNIWIIVAGRSDRDLNAAINWKQLATGSFPGKDTPVKRGAPRHANNCIPGATRRDSKRVFGSTAYPESKDNGGLEHAGKAMIYEDVR